jgi:hypothetical protein
VKIKVSINPVKTSIGSTEKKVVRKRNGKGMELPTEPMLLILPALAKHDYYTDDYYDCDDSSS